MRDSSFYRCFCAKCPAYFIKICKLDADNALKFELEIRKYPANSLGYLLLNDSFQQFEDFVSKKFVNQLHKSICSETFFTDWLNSLLRLHFNKPKKHLLKQLRIIWMGI